ncbi:heme-containing dehydratase [Penicillium brevicompactum]|uniref:heme-containing dehydratase n=1 Tax=Penicillium brevicompactum TaxID=5074 RepID=UPI002541C462|nr:heme-containing dehydratase [Penicillium brevicompactum]KAJ5349014.1 heme-containing dehydratase [Penicillium brevicompactum]
MWTVKFPDDKPFVYSIFGIQYPTGQPNEEQSDLKTRFNDLITGHPDHVDRLIQDGCASIAGGRTHIWLAYWKSNAQYESWWNQKEVVHFWNTLSAGSGMWREILKPSPRRTQYGTNQLSKTGMGHLGDRASLGEHAGYWGCYRQRMADAATDKFATDSGSVCPHMASKNDSDRVHFTEFPENLCFVVEGQDHSALTADERAYWFDNFDSSVNEWISDLVKSGPEAGILDARLCYEPESGTFRESEPRAMNYNKKVQLFFFRDLGHMERIGRLHKGHADLRRRFLESYGPGGAMENGKICLWVETSVLKADEVECEYVGCVQGTGFMSKG